MKERTVTVGEEAVLVARFMNYKTSQRNVGRSPPIRRHPTLNLL